MNSQNTALLFCVRMLVLIKDERCFPYRGSIDDVSITLVAPVKQTAIIF